MATTEFDAARITDALVPLAADEVLVAQADAAPPPATGDAPATTIIEVGEGSVLTLPAGAGIENPRVNGTNLEFVQPDGTVIVVPNGAITGLTIVIDGTTIPAETVAALFEASGIETAAGPEGPTAPPSSGGNFANPVPGIGEGLPLIDLLPPTDFGLPTPDLEDLPAGLAFRSAAFNGPPSFVDPKNGLAIDSFLLNAVSEEEENRNGGVAPGFAGFPSSSNPDTAGSDDTTNSRVSSGVITVVDPEDDALTFTLDEPYEALTSQGQTVFWTGQGTNQLVGHVGAVDGPVVITISVVDGTASSGGGAYTVVLSGPIDHPNDSRTDPADPDEDDFSLNIPVTVSDGVNTDTATLVLPIEDDSPEMSARKAETTTETTTETIFYSLQAGNTDMRGMNGSGGRDILLTGLDVYEGDNSVNTSGSSIGVGDGQSVDGYELSGPKANPNISGPELLNLEFLKDLVITPNPPGAPTVAHAGSYDVASVKFTVDVAEAHGIEEAVVFVGSNDGSQFQSSIKVNGVVVGSPTPVFEGGIQVGYVFVVPDDATVEVIGATPFDALRIGNYNDFAFDSNDDAVADATLSGGNSFKVLGVEASVTIVTTTTEVLAVSHDETLGTNPGADPNPSNDTDDTPPALLAGAAGYARSSINALSLFSHSVGADGGASYTFAITDAAGTALGNAPSGLFTLDGTAILLSTDGDGVLVGAAGGNTVFKVLVDTDGTVWIAQYLPIAHDLDGGTAAAYDDVAVVLADLHVKATITDFDKDPAEAISDVALRVEFQDDGPNAVDDSNTISEDALSVTGQVVTGTGADAFGLDGAAATGPVIALESGPAGTSDTNPAGDFVVAGLYGTLTLDASGAYTYTLYTALQNPAAYAVVQSLGPAGSLSDEVFTYTIADGDGDTDTATLTITITGSDDGVTITGIGAQAGDHTVYEDDLADGSSTDIPALTRTGTFNISAPDGVDDLTVGGVAIVTSGVVTGNVGVAFDTDYGRLTITSVNLGTGEVAYSYELDDNTLAHGPGDDAKNAVFDTIAVVLTDTDTSNASTSLLIKVTDDIPDAVDDTASQSPENAPVTVNVVADDEPGADGVAVSAVTYVANTLTGPGTLTNNGDGSFTYTPLPGETGVVAFDYQITDGDGDRSVATVTITLTADSTPTVTVTDGTVDEKGLADGSGELADPAPDTDGSETTTGTFSYTTGGDTLTKLEVEDKDGVWQNVTAGGTVTGLYGTLTVTNLLGAYSWSYTLAANTLTHTGLDQTGVSDQVFDSFRTRATDSDGDITDADGISASETITIAVNDDGPNAVDDAVAAPVAEDGSVLIDVFANDVAGADAVDLLTGVTIVTGPTKGTLTYNDDGTFSYQAAAGAEGPDSFTYQIEDGDGDTDIATVSLSIATDSMPTVTVTDGTVDEKGLADGSGERTDPAPDTDGSETTTGTFSYTTGGDTLTKLEVEDKDGVWQNVTAGGTVTGLYGTLTVTNLLGAHSWSYTLADNTLTHTGLDQTGAADQVFDSFRTRATDSDGDITDADGISATETITIAINDDGPNAVDDAAATPVAEDGSVQIDVFVNDVAGADGVDLLTGVTIVTGPTKGKLTYNDDGTFTYEAAAGAEGPDSFTYQIEDGDGDTDIATVSLSIAADSTPEISSANSVSLDEDGLAPANRDNAPLLATEQDSTESTSAIGTIVVQFGDDKPTDLLAAFKFVTTGLGDEIDAFGADVVWSLSNSDRTLTGKVGVIDVVEISITSATDDGGGQVTYGYTARLLQPLTHPANDVEDSVAIDDIDFVVTDRDADMQSGSFDVVIHDDVPKVGQTTNLIYANASNDGAGAALGGTGEYSYSIGADQHSGTLSVANSDFASIVLSGTVGSNAINVTTAPIWQSETATSATFAFAFTYAKDPTQPGILTANTGTITFDKAAGTYTVELASPIESYATLTTTDPATVFTGYDAGTSNVDAGGQADVSVAALAPGLFAQFRGYGEPGGSDPLSNLQAITLASALDTTDPLDPTTQVFVAGELFRQGAKMVSVSGSAAGVAGDTMGAGEVLDITLYNANPTGVLGGAPTAMASGILLKFDGIVAGPNVNADMVVVLRLIDPSTLAVTTKAVVVDIGDIYKSGDILPSGYVVALDNNDGVIFIESNDYNGPGENWMIQGLQVLSSTEGITGSGINLDSSHAASVGTQSFGATTSDGDGFKISSIGVTALSTQTSDASLSFVVVNADADGDESAPQTLTVTIEGGSTLVGTIAAESINGFNGADSLSGAGGNDILAGRGGADIIDGGLGVDTADYSDSAAAVSINLDDAGEASGAPPTFSAPLDGDIGGGDAAGDTLTGIENLRGGGGDDYLYGNSAANGLHGGDGVDYLDGEGGIDFLAGGAGNDNLTGGSDVDTFVFAEFGAAHVDTITDFVVGPTGDQLDLSAILDVAFGPGSDVSDFVKVTDTGADSVVQVDVTGNGNFAATGDVAVLNNVGSTDSIRIFFEGVEHSVIVIDQP